MSDPLFKWWLGSMMQLLMLEVRGMTFLGVFFFSWQTKVVVLIALIVVCAASIVSDSLAVRRVACDLEISPNTTPIRLCR